MKKVGLIGVGAVGAIYGWRLSELLGYENVEIIVDDKRKERYEREGIYLNEKQVSFNYVTTPLNDEKSDLIIIATKNNHLEKAIASIAPFVKEETTIISLLNGIDSEEILATHFGKEKLLYAFTTALDSTRLNNKINFSTEGIIYFGEKDNVKTDRIKKIEKLFSDAKINHIVPDDIHLEMWAKFMVNVSINTVSAITGATYGQCASFESLKTLIIESQKEVIELAQKIGIKGLDHSYIQKYQKIFASLEYGGKTSMLQDMESKRETENRWFCLRASELGKSVGLKLPLVEHMGLIVEGLEAVNQDNKKRPPQ